jgi:cytochrome c biogenesis protein CcmG/thiol:disulfide interchange protein DsbE
VSTKVQWVIVGALVALLGLGVWSARAQLGAELFPLRIGSAAPDFSAVPLAPGAEPKGIDDYRGEVVLLNIWATWCGPCRVEMPSMERLERQLGPKGLRIVAVSVDVAGMEESIKAFTEEMQLSFEILHDAPGKIQQRYQTTGVPETFIIGRDGRVRRRVIGADDWSSAANVAFLERLLAEPAPR